MKKVNLLALASALFLLSAVVCAGKGTIVLFPILGIILSLLCGLVVLEETGKMDKIKNTLNW